MPDRIDVLQVGNRWRIFINGGIVTRGTERLVPREFKDRVDAWDFLFRVQKHHLERTGEHLGWGGTQ